MQKLILDVDDPDDLLDGYGTGALIRVERDTSESMATSAEITTIPIVVGQLEYEYWDQTGTPADYYRVRYSKASPLLDTDYSDYSPVFQATTPAQYTDLFKVKSQAKIEDDTDDAFLIDAIDAADAWMRGEMHGIFIGPSTDTSRTFDLPKASRTVFIPGGVRSVSSLQIREYTGGPLQTILASDYVLRPQAWQRLAGMTTDRIEFVDSIGITGSYTHFYAGYGTAVVNSTAFGPEKVPPDLSRIATTVVIWLHRSRAAGEGAVIGNIDTGELIVNRVLTPFDGWTLQRYRNAVDSFDWV